MAEAPRPKRPAYSVVGPPSCKEPAVSQAVPALPAQQHGGEQVIAFTLEHDARVCPVNTGWGSGARADASACDATAQKRAGLFREHFKKYEAGGDAEIKAAGPA